MSKTITAMSAVLVLTSINAFAQSDVQSPVAFTEKDQCASCGMWITRYPGPKGEIILKDKTTLKFCSARGMACEVLKLKAEGKLAGVAMFVHNTNAVDWKHPADAHLIDAAKAWYVYASDMKAVMGPSLAPFADRQAAEAFAKAHGGKVYELKDLTQEVLGCKVRN